MTLDPIAAQQAAIRNRPHLVGGCGCFHCLARFPASSVAAYTDDGQTALCPVCGMDAVIPGDALTRAELATLKRRWFKLTPDAPSPPP